MPARRHPDAAAGPQRGVFVTAAALALLGLLGYLMARVSSPAVQPGRV
jgi:hypothetical protein